jgi:hypothetical protein
MGILDETRFIERQHFFNGQRLFASDLQGLEAFNREMRWLHNRSLHQPGIGSGYAVSGKKGDREITARPGYAIDALGREIVLTEDRTETVPPVAGEDDGTPVFYDLTVSYPDDADLEEAETRGGACLPGGVVRLREKPVFCWVRLQKDDRGALRPKDPALQRDIKNGLKIVLARAEVLNCQLNADLSVTERRNARPPTQPYIAGATVEPTDWQVLDIGSGAAKAAALHGASAGSFPAILPYGLTAQIDTSAAGFLTSPAYSAQIIGPRIKAYNGDSVFIDGLVSLRDPRPGGFIIDVALLYMYLEGDSPEIPLALMETPHSHTAVKNGDFDAFLEYFTDWQVVWMGAEG